MFPNKIQTLSTLFSFGIVIFTALVIVGWQTMSVLAEQIPVSVTVVDTPQVLGTETTNICHADYDHSGKIDGSDLYIFSSFYKQPLSDCSIDIVGDGKCTLDIMDLKVFASTYEKEVNCITIDLER